MGKIWLAGTLGEKAWRKYRKKDILDEEIEKCCISVMEPPKPLAFSTQGILMFGVCKIYEYQVISLWKTTNESYGKLLRYAQRGKKKKIDLPTTELQANLNDITLQQRVQVEIDDIGDIDLREVMF